MADIALCICMMMLSISGRLVYTLSSELRSFASDSNQYRIRTDFGKGFASSSYTIYGWYRAVGTDIGSFGLVTLSNELETNGNFVTDQPFLVVVRQRKAEGVSLVFWLRSADRMIDKTVGVAPDDTDQWTFYAVSADYEEGQAVFFVKGYGGQTSPSATAAMALQTGFSLARSVEGLMGSSQSLGFAPTPKGFVGTTGPLELATMFSEELEVLRLGFLKRENQAGSGIVLDMYFDIYSMSEKLVTQGEIKTSLAPSGTYAPAITGTGVTFRAKGGVALPGVGLRGWWVEGLGGGGVQGLSFFFNVLVEEPMPQSLVILTRGVEGVNGFMRLSLEINNGERLMKVELRGSSSGLSHLVPFGLPSGRRIQIFTGVVLSPGGKVDIVYWDSLGRTEAVGIGEVLDFARGELPLQLLYSGGDSQVFNPTGSITFYRFTILSSSSGGLLLHLLGAQTPFSATCILATSFYASDPGCLYCRSSIAMQQIPQCTLYCPRGFKNGGSDICVACISPDCKDLNSTKFSLSRIESNRFLLSPSRPLGPYRLTPDLFDVQVEGSPSKPFTQSIERVVGNDSLWLHLNFTASSIDSPLRVTLNQRPQNPVFDTDYNLLYDLVTVGEPLNACVEGGGVEGLRGLGAALATALLVTPALLSAIIVLCRPPKINGAELGKLWLGAWTKGQLIALLALPGVDLPCCVKGFLGPLYWVLVGWNQGLGRWIDTGVGEDPVYLKTRNPSTLPSGWMDKGATPFFLHNFGVALVVVVIGVVGYVAAKVLRKNNGSIAARLVDWAEFGAVIVLLELVGIQLFAFAAVNVRNPSTAIAYGTVGLVIGILCSIAAFLFMAFSVFRLWPRNSASNLMTNDRRFAAYEGGWGVEGLRRLYGPLVLCAQGLAGLSIGLLYSRPIAMVSIVTASVVIWAALRVLLRPPTPPLASIAEFVSLGALVAMMGLLVAVAVLRGEGSIAEGLRGEGWFCVCLVIAMVVAVGVPLLAGVVQVAMDFFKPPGEDTMIPPQDSMGYLLKQPPTQLYFGSTDEKPKLLNPEMGLGSISGFPDEKALIFGNGSPRSPSELSGIQISALPANLLPGGQGAFGPVSALPTSLSPRLQGTFSPLSGATNAFSPRSPSPPLGPPGLPASSLSRDLDILIAPIATFNTPGAKLKPLSERKSESDADGYFLTLRPESSDRQPFNPSTPQHLNSSPPQPLNASPPEIKLFNPDNTVLEDNSLLSKYRQSRVVNNQSERFSSNIQRKHSPSVTPMSEDKDRM